MTRRSDIEALVAAADTAVVDAMRHSIVQPRAGITPRFDVYHAGLSVCSQKIRTVLAEHGAPYRSHEMVILNSRGIYSAELTPAENYRPAYVKLRLAGGAQVGRAATGYSGRSSVTTEGFDACVVPTLVDREAVEVVVDSLRICEHLDASAAGSQRLIPEDATSASAVRQQMAIVDGTPHPAALYGFHPEDDRRPDFIKHVMGDVYDLKVAALRQLIEDNHDDQALVAAYTNKISKELGGKSFAHDATMQHKIRGELQGIVESLESQLEQHAAPWVCGTTFTMADVFWGVSLYRLQWLGLASLWAQFAHVAAYTRQLYRHPSLRTAVIEWPSPMPASPHTTEVSMHYRDAT